MKNFLKKNMGLGFFWPEHECLSDGWYEILMQRTAHYPMHHFSAPKRLAIIHPQLFFGRNKFSEDLAHFYRNAPTPNDMFLPCIVGKTENGLVFHDFVEDIIHLAVSGITGAGKTSGIYAILFSLMWLNLPNWLKISIFATKSFSFFKPIANVYDTVEKMRNGARELVKRLRERLEILNKQKTAHTVRMYNREHRNKIMRYELILIDEFTNILRSLKGEERDKFVGNIAQIAAQGRSLGMLIILMPQRPDSEGLPAPIKPQMVSSLTFRLKTDIDANTAGCPEAVYLDEREAILNSKTCKAKLDMLYMPEEWAPFFCTRVQKTMRINGYKDGFK